ncbi:MAG: leucyl/phenylalanyl-tRNA--protein transferase [Muribaculaceae bacterium]|nr:leucyl/phenylalanyl-tRNA--protein transferase [Muribaculaceae bacterium]
MFDSIDFPDPREGEEDGLFAIGGDLSPQRLLLAYSMGAFPWFSFRDSSEPLWYCPMKRFVIFPDEIHISHSTRNLINKKIYTCSINKAFDRVIRGCASKRIDMPGAWLGNEMIEAYTTLHKMGLAASVEVWKGDILVGGLYGVTLNSAFFGESMFSSEPGVSKLALIHLARTMAGNGGSLIDCQFETPHLKSMGGRIIDYEEYMRIIHIPTWLPKINNK